MAPNFGSSTTGLPLFSWAETSTAPQVVKVSPWATWTTKSWKVIFWMLRSPPSVGSLLGALEHEWILTFHSVGNFIIPDFHSIISHVETTTNQLFIAEDFWLQQFWDNDDLSFCGPSAVQAIPGETEQVWHLARGVKFWVAVFTIFGGFSKIDKSSLARQRDEWRI